MKRFILTFSAAFMLILTVSAQKFKVESAKISHDQGVLDEAKLYIDEAAQHESTKNDRFMHYVRAMVYYKIASEESFKHLDAEAGPKALQSAITCIKLDMAEKKPKYRTECELLMVNSASSTYMYGQQQYQKAEKLLEADDKEAGKKEMQKTIDAWEQILGAYEFDTEKQIDKWNLSKASMYQNLFIAASRMGDRDQARKYLNGIKESENPLPYAYTQDALLYLEQGDTTAALKVVEIGRSKFPDDKDLTTLELAIYQNQGRENELTDKITEALELDPENPNLLYNRGTLFDKQGRALVEKMKPLIIEIPDLKQKLGRTYNAEEKKKLQAQIDAKEAELKALEEKQQRVDSLAIADYKKAYDANPDMFDAIYNLGAIYFNMTVPYLEKTNSIPYGMKGGEQLQAEYKKNYEDLFNKALEWFLKGEELKPDDTALLYNIQTTYAQLGNVEKSVEYKNKREGQ